LCGLVIQALRYMGREHVDDKAISRMKQKPKWGCVAFRERPMRRVRLPCCEAGLLEELGA